MADEPSPGISDGVEPRPRAGRRRGARYRWKPRLSSSDAVCQASVTAPSPGGARRTGAPRPSAPARRTELLRRRGDVAAELEEQDVRLDHALDRAASSRSRPREVGAHVVEVGAAVHRVGRPAGRVAGPVDVARLGEGVRDVREAEAGLEVRPAACRSSTPSRGRRAVDHAPGVASETFRPRNWRIGPEVEVVRPCRSASTPAKPGCGSGRVGEVLARRRSSGRPRAKRVGWPSEPAV